MAKSTLVLGAVVAALLLGLSLHILKGVPQTDGVVTEIKLPTIGGGPTTLSITDDGRVWFTLSAANAIGRVEADGSGYTQFDLPHPGSSPRIIAIGADGNLWFS